MVIDPCVAEIGVRQPLQASDGIIGRGAPAADILKKAAQCLFVHRLHCA